MTDAWQRFERMARHAYAVEPPDDPSSGIHPFEQRDIHRCLPEIVRRLFDNGHFAQATFEAYKYLDNTVASLSKLNDSGKSLMMRALNEKSPVIILKRNHSLSERNRQEGYKFIFAGSMIAIRNPRGHEHDIDDTFGTCLDHLGIVSHLLRTLEDANYILE